MGDKTSGDTVNTFPFRRCPGDEVDAFVDTAERVLFHTISPYVHHPIIHPPASLTTKPSTLQAMAQDIVGNAGAFANDLKTTGHVAVEGILFETGKSELKPESAQAIAEVAKLLKEDAGLKLFVVGHTDNVGVLEGNMKLSQDRAQSVVQALVRTHGVEAARLRAYGDGPYAPVASNDSEAGRVKNRRVELVKQ
jgi:outer membrane protein OmpA-like peptidoglycan-associated protein